MLHRGTFCHAVGAVGYGELVTTTLFVSATREEAAYLPAGTDLIITGIGTLNCAIALTKELAGRSTLPDRIINIGTAGGLRDGITGVYEIARVFQHDFSSDVISQMLGRPYPNGRGLPVSGRLPVAHLATGDAFISDTATRDLLARSAHLCDMEGAAVAAVAASFGVPVTLLKQVSDEADEGAVTTWFEAVDAGAKELYDALIAHNFLP